MNKPCVSLALCGVGDAATGGEAGGAGDAATGGAVSTISAWNTQSQQYKISIVYWKRYKRMLNWNIQYTVYT